MAATNIVIDKHRSDGKWKLLEQLHNKLLQEERVSVLRQKCLSELTEVTWTSKAGASSAPFKPERTSVEREEVLLRIEKVIEDVVCSISKDEAPAMSYPSRSSWENVIFQEGIGLELKSGGTFTSVKFDSIMSVNKFALILKLLSKIYHLVQTNTYCTKRDLYYQDPKLFGSQNYIDDLINHVSCMLRVPRWQLHLLATSKGCIAGEVQYVETDGHYVDCRNTTSGILIPGHVQGIQSLHSKAKFVLVIEKDATFQRLVDDGVCAKLYPCIVITGKGFPDVNTRLMVRKLWDELHLPTFALVDADPHGIEIMTIYKFGSKSLSFESPSLTVPSLRWLGVWPSDINRMQIQKDALMPLTATDRDKAQELLNRPYISAQPGWKSELESLLASGLKAEIQCLQSVSATFLVDVYLPNKIQYGGWM